MPAQVFDQVVDDLTITCEELNRRGFPARLVTYDIAGELDIRLQAHLPGSAMTVEVLGPWPFASESRTDCWQAVRISPWDRAVWVGPPRSQAFAGLDLIGFMKDLLCRDERELASYYQRAG